MPASEVDLTAVAQIIGSASGAITPPVVIFLLIKRIFVSGAEVTSLQKQLDAKDAALARKDEQLLALNTGMSDRAIPAITEAIVTMRELAPIVQKLAPLLQTDVSIRDRRT